MLSQFNSATEMTTQKDSYIERYDTVSQYMLQEETPPIVANEMKYFYLYEKISTMQLWWDVSSGIMRTK